MVEGKYYGPYITYYIIITIIWIRVHLTFWGCGQSDSRQCLNDDVSKFVLNINEP